MLSPLEIAAGFPLPGGEQIPASLPSRLEPRAALAACMVAPLSRPPCIVSFSGGRDSSLVLALAVDVARREGLPLPVPVTVRPSGDVDAEEGAWQERVVEHLGLDDWVRVAIGDGLDCIGPHARRTLLEHGVLWPANVHFHLPQFERATGGSVLTGVGGDEVFSTSGWARIRLVLGREARPEPRDALRLAGALAPAAVRKRVVIARSEVDLEWLRPGAQREVIAGLAEEAAAEPLRWRRRFGWVLGLRYLEVGMRGLDVLAADWDVEMHHPLLDPTFVGTLGALPPEQRFNDRTEALTTLFAGLLPVGLESRTSKAVFAETLWGGPSRAFAMEWDGSGVDPEIVDADALRRRWQVDGVPGPHTLLQSLWLARQGSASIPSNSSSVAGNDAQDRGRRSSQAGSALS